MDSREKSTCFVVMGYGIKKMPGTLIKLNLDEVYFEFIKPVLLDAKLVSIYSNDSFRGDEVSTSIAIHKSFIKSIFFADIVIADISTLNQNAIYELGLRHAMKSKSTIILSESNTFEKFPFFDISMYPRLIYDREKIIYDLDYRTDMQKKLKEKINTCINSNEKYIDSPVFDLDLYTISPNIAHIDFVSSDDLSLRELLKNAENLKECNEFSKAEDAYKEILNITFDEDVFSQYILCMYKKDISTANLLKTFNFLINKVELETTTNEDILGIAAAINKNLFNLTNNEDFLSASLRYYKNGANFDKGNLYCVRNYCAMLLKKYKVSNDIETIKEHYYTAVHSARENLTEAMHLKREKTDMNDIWFNSNLNDLMFIIYGEDNSILNLECATNRQKETIINGEAELKLDYNNMIKKMKN